MPAGRKQRPMQTVATDPPEFSMRKRLGVQRWRYTRARKGGVAVRQVVQERVRQQNDARRVQALDRLESDATGGGTEVGERRVVLRCI
jgi:hypothetical protein